MVFVFSYHANYTRDIWWRSRTLSKNQHHSEQDPGITVGAARRYMERLPVHHVPPTAMPWARTAAVPRHQLWRPTPLPNRAPGQGVPCLQCGWLWHHTSVCPAASKQCQKCGNDGHYARQCWSRSSSQSTSQEAARSTSKQRRSQRCREAFNKSKAENQQLAMEVKDLRASVTGLEERL